MVVWIRPRLWYVTGTPRCWVEGDDRRRRPIGYGDDAVGFWYGDDDVVPIWYGEDAIGFWYGDDDVGFWYGDDDVGFWSSQSEL